MCNSRTVEMLHPRDKVKSSAVLVDPWARYSGHDVTCLKTVCNSLCLHWTICLGIWNRPRWVYLTLQNHHTKYGMIVKKIQINIFVVRDKGNVMHVNSHMCIHLTRWVAKWTRVNPEHSNASKMSEGSGYLMCLQSKHVTLAYNTKNKGTWLEILYHINKYNFVFGRRLRGKIRIVLIFSGINVGCPYAWYNYWLPKNRKLG